MWFRCAICSLFLVSAMMLFEKCTKAPVHYDHCLILAQRKLICLNLLFIMRNFYFNKEFLRGYHKNI